MRLPDQTNPVHCASKDDTRYILNSVAIRGDLAIATDGRTLFVAKGCRDDEDDTRDALIPKRAAAAAWPQTKRKKGAILPLLTINKPDQLTESCTIINRDMDKTTVRDIDGKFPDCSKAVPDASKYRHRVGINVKLLLQIAKCYGDDQVYLHFDSDGWRDGAQSEPIIVLAKSTEAFGVLMPLRSADSAPLKNAALLAITTISNQ